MKLSIVSSSPALSSAAPWSLVITCSSRAAALTVSSMVVLCCALSVACVAAPAPWELLAWTAHGLPKAQPLVCAKAES